MKMVEEHECQYERCDNLTANPKYCSLSCGAKQQSINHPRAAQKPKCLRVGCNNLVNCYGSKYCSHSCAAKTLNKRRGKQCKDCGSKFFNSNRWYCAECSDKRTPAGKVKSWLAGDWVLTGRQLPKVIRDFLLDEAQYKCTSPDCCVPGGWGEINQKSGKTPLTIDHIDGDADNNKRENLRVLCPNCHSLTETYGGLNRGNGREWRRNRYAKVTQ